MAIQEIMQSETIDKDRWAAGVWRLHRTAGAMVETPSSIIADGTKKLRCGWDDAIASVPTDQEIADAADAAEAEKDAEKTNTDDAKTKLLNNADLIRQAMLGINDARTALDAVIPIDTTNQSTTVNTLAQRQAAVLFLSANSLRAVMALAKRGDLPDEIIDEFLA